MTLSVAVAMSGGVDSSLVAALLLEQGHRVFGVTMRTASEAVKLPPGAGKACFSPDSDEDQQAAARLCQRLGIDHHLIDLSQPFRERVIQTFQREYLAGRTPNPCVICNRHIKFGALWEAIREKGLAFDRFATGHYVRVAFQEGRWRLLKGLDPKKDQSYFLTGLPAALLPHLLFPLGALDKGQVRDMARRMGLEVAEKAESQDFVSGGDYSPLFEGHPQRPGDIVDEAGKVLGRHSGIIHYTIGQRKGLGIAASHPLYVVRLDAANNRVVVSDKAGLEVQGLEACQVNWVSIDPPLAERRVEAKVRLGPRTLGATLLPEPGDASRFCLRFDVPQGAVAPGQYAVLYDGDRLLGGGVIERTF